MGHTWWVTGVEWAVLAVTAVLLVRWLARSHARSNPGPGAACLLHPRSTLVVSLVSAGFFFGIALLCYLFSDDITSLRTMMVFVGFGLLSLTMGVDYFVARHHVSVRGIDYGRLTGPRRSMAWQQVRRLRYSPSMKWFKIESHEGEVARVSAMMLGLPEFARLALAHVPADAIDERTLHLLHDTAAGAPLPTWA